MTTIKSLEKDGRRSGDLIFFPKWKENELDVESQVHHSCTMNIVRLPYVHHGFGVKDDGLTLKAWIAFGLERLHRVRQLAFVRHPFMVSMDGKVEEALCFSHTRASHVLDVMSVIALIEDNNHRMLEKVHPQSQNLLRLAAITHDTLTPAGGDTVKMIDPEAFDEDARYHQLFSDIEGREERHALCTELGLNWADVDRVVLGEGLFGHLLDMADKTGYVSRDTAQFLDFCQGGKKREQYFPEYPHIAKLVEQDPWICGWWESVRTDGMKAWVEDGERLARFLELRLRMFRGLYYHDKRAADFILPSVVTGYLYRSGQLTRDQLLEMSDEQLERLIATFCGVPHFNLRKVAPVEMMQESFDTNEEVRRRERALVAKGFPFTYVENIREPLKPSYMKFKVKRKGTIQPFITAFKDEAHTLDELCREVVKPWRLCYFSENKLPPEHRKDLLAFRRKQVGLDP